MRESQIESELKGKGGSGGKNWNKRRKVREGLQDGEFRGCVGEKPS